MPVQNDISIRHQVIERDMVGIMEQIILEFRKVNGNKGKFRLKNINFTLPAGYICGLVGSNGAGKTTLMNYILSDIKRYTGNIYLEGKDIHTSREWVKNRIGFVSEDNAFFTERSAAQNAELLGRFYEHFDTDIFMDSLKEMEVSPGRIYNNMSRGEKIKFQLAFAMAHKPVLYLLDEATAGMDPVFRIDFYKILHRLVEEGNASVLMTTHIESEIARQTDYVGIMENGNLLSFGESLDLVSEG